MRATAKPSVVHYTNLHQQIQSVPPHAKVIRDENVRLTDHRSLITLFESGRLAQR